MWALLEGGFDSSFFVGGGGFRRDFFFSFRGGFGFLSPFVRGCGFLLGLWRGEGVHKSGFYGCILEFWDSFSLCSQVGSLVILMFS